MDIERLRQAVIDKRFILSANPDWRAGRSCGLSDDETEQKANDALTIILESIAELVVAYLIDARQSEKEKVVCPDCGGSGVYQEYDEYDRYYVHACGTCDGSGEVDRQPESED